MASDCDRIDHAPGAPEPLSGAVWNCTCRVAEPPEVNAATTSQSNISWSVTAPPMSWATPRSMMLVETVLPVPVGLSPASAENWFCLSMSMLCVSPQTTRVSLLRIWSQMRIGTPRKAVYGLESRVSSVRKLLALAIAWMSRAARTVRLQ